MPVTPNYPNNPVSIPQYVQGQTLAGPPEHSDMHDRLQAETEAIATYATKAVLGGEEGLTTVTTTGGAFALSLATANLIVVNMAGNPTFTMPSARAGRVCSFTLVMKQDSTGGRVPAWPSSIRWHGGSAPTVNSVPNSETMVSFMSWDAGVSWRGFYAGTF